MFPSNYQSVESVVFFLISVWRTCYLYNVTDKRLPKLKFRKYTFSAIVVCHDKYSNVCITVCVLSLAGVKLHYDMTGSYYILQEPNYCKHKYRICFTILIHVF